VNNLIILKELQVICGTLSKGDEGLRKKKKNSKRFSWVFFEGGGEDGVTLNPKPFLKGGFVFKGLA